MRTLLSTISLTMAGTVLGQIPVTPGQPEPLPLASRKTYQLSNADFAARMQTKLPVTDSRQTVESAMEAYALSCIGQPYAKVASRFDLEESDCVVFVERAIAYVLSQEWASYYLSSERIRHKDGAVDYRQRNFNTLTDWLPNNSWLLEDVTARLGPHAEVSREFTYVEREKVFETVGRRTVFKGSNWWHGKQQVHSARFVPRDNLGLVLDDLRSGDIFLCIVASSNGHYGCDHLGLVIKSTDGSTTVVHSAPPQVRQEPLLAFIEAFPRVQGMLFLRMREGARRIMSAETQRMASAVAVPTPQKMDAKVRALRASRRSPLARTLEPAPTSAPAVR